VREPRLAAEFIEDGRTLISLSSQHELIKQDAAMGATLEVNERRPSTALAKLSRAVFFDMNCNMLSFRLRLKFLQLCTESALYSLRILKADTMSA
jgi:hypothetical protein